MALLDPYSPALTSDMAAHLLRRATCGPTPQEIEDFTGLTAQQAVELLINNAVYTATPPPPVDMLDEDSGTPFLDQPFDFNKNYNRFLSIQFWWIGLLTQQSTPPSLLEKLVLFWQNHFVVTWLVATDYRATDQYLRLLRSMALGNFKTFAIAITKDPGMLLFQNGNENDKEFPNENYARELQELFVVGAKDYYGNDNYTEADVKAASRVLTGWRVRNYQVTGTSNIYSEFELSRHDTEDKTFSAFYQNRTITGRNDASAGDTEITELVDMLIKHTESAKYIVRKLYRFYVNNQVSQTIEDEVIIPLAQFFASPENNFEIAPLLTKLLTCNHFYDSSNIGAIIKSPAEHTIGTIRYFQLPVPDITTEYHAFRKMMEFIEWRMSPLQLRILTQDTVFGPPAYYQTGYSKNWINGTTLGLRGHTADNMVYPWLEVKPGYMLGIDFIKWVREIQPNFEDVDNTPAITAEALFEALTTNLLAVSPTQAQKDFLIDTILMRGIPRTSWLYELNAFRRAPEDIDKQNPINWRCIPLIQYLLKTAEYQVF